VQDCAAIRVLGYTENCGMDSSRDCVLDSSPNCVLDSSPNCVMDSSPNCVMDSSRDSGLCSEYWASAWPLRLVFRAKIWYSRCAYTPHDAREPHAAKET